MRVLVLISQHHWTGAAEPALRTARSLADQGFQVEVAFDRSRPGTLGKAIADLGLPERRDLLLCRRPFRMGNFLADCRRLASAIDRDGIDVVWCHLGHDHWTALCARRLTSREFRIVRSLHTSAHSGRRPMCGRLYESADAVLTIGGGQGQGLLRNYPGLDQDRIFLEGGGVDELRFAPGIARPTIEGLPESAQAIGIVSRIKPGRGHELLIDAFADVSGEFPEARLVVVGRGEGKAQIEERAREAGLDDRVLFLGFRDQDLPGIISRMNALVLLGEGSDGTCRAVLEAQSCGVPVIAADVGSVAEQVIDGGTGWVLAEPDRASLAAAVRDALSDPAAAMERGRRGRELVLERFTERARAGRVREALERASRMPHLDAGPAALLTDVGLLAVMSYFVFALTSITIAQISLAVAAAAWLARGMLRRDLRPGGRPLWPPILAFLGVGFLAALAAADRPAALHGLRDHWVLLTPLIVASFLGVNQVRAALLALVLGSVPISIFGVMQHWAGWFSYPVKDNLHSGEVLRNTYHTLGLFSHHLTMANLLAMVLAVSLGLYFQRTWEGFKPLGFPLSVLLGRVRRPWSREARSKALFMAGVVPLVPAMFFTYGRSAWVGLFAAIVYFGYHKGRRALMALISLAAAAGLITTLISPSLHKRIQSMGQAGANIERILTWESTVAMIEDHPLLGVGPGNYRGSIGPYREGYNISFTSSAHAHNIYLQIPAEYGLMGLAALVWLLVTIFRIGLGRASGRLPPRPDVDLHLGVLAALVAFAVAGAFQHVFGDEEVVMLFGALAGTLVPCGIHGDAGNEES